MLKVIKPGKVEVKPQVVKWCASCSPKCCCQLGTVFTSDKGETNAVSDVRFTVADDTSGCPLLNTQDLHWSENRKKYLRNDRYN